MRRSPKFRRHAANLKRRLRLRPRIRRIRRCRPTRLKTGLPQTTSDASTSAAGRRITLPFLRLRLTEKPPDFFRADSRKGESVSTENGDSENGGGLALPVKFAVVCAVFDSCRNSCRACHFQNTRRIMRENKDEKINSFLFFAAVCVSVSLFACVPSFAAANKPSFSRGCKRHNIMEKKIRCRLIFGRRSDERQIPRTCGHYAGGLVRYRAFAAQCRGRLTNILPFCATV